MGDDKTHPRKLRSQIYSKLKSDKPSGGGFRIEPLIDSDTDDDIAHSRKTRADQKNVKVSAQPLKVRESPVVVMLQDLTDDDLTLSPRLNANDSNSSIELIGDSSPHSVQSHSPTSGKKILSITEELKLPKSKLLSIAELGSDFSPRQSLLVDTIITPSPADSITSIKDGSRPRKDVLEKPSTDFYREKQEEQKKEDEKTKRERKPYRDIDLKISDQNEVLMNLQRQKVWNNSQNARLELEVEALQRQLAALDRLDEEMSQGCSSSSLNKQQKSEVNAMGSSLNIRLPVNGNKRPLLAVGAIPEQASIAARPLNLGTKAAAAADSSGSRTNLYDVPSGGAAVGGGNKLKVGRRPRQRSVDGLDGNTNALLVAAVSGLALQDCGIARARVHDKQQTQAPVAKPRRRPLQSDAAAFGGDTDEEGGGTYQFNIQRGKPLSRVAVAPTAQDDHAVKNNNAKIRRRTVETKEPGNWKLKYDKLVSDQMGPTKENEKEKRGDIVNKVTSEVGRRLKDPNMFVDDGYSSNDDSKAEEEQTNKLNKIKQSKLNKMNRRRNTIGDDTDEKNVVTHRMMLEGASIAASAVADVPDKKLFNSLKSVEHSLLDVDLSKKVDEQPKKPVGFLSGMMSFMRKNSEGPLSAAKPTGDYTQEISPPTQQQQEQHQEQQQQQQQVDLKGEDTNDEDSVVEEVGARLGRRGRDRKQFRQPKIPLPFPVEAPKPVEDAHWTFELDNMWIETSLLLRVPIKSAEDLIFIEASAEAGLLFMSELDEVAKSLQVLRGSLSRWLLPYDQNTRLDEQSSTPHSVLENMPAMLKGKLSERQVHYLVRGANNVRKLVRIKIADDNDLEQARVALKTAMSFIRKLNERAAMFDKSPFEFIELRPGSAIC